MAFPIDTAKAGGQTALGLLVRRLLLRHHLADFLAEHTLDFVLHRFGAGFAEMRPHKVVVHPGRNKTIQQRANLLYSIKRV